MIKQNTMQNGKAVPRRIPYEYDLWYTLARSLTIYIVFLLLSPYEKCYLTEFSNVFAHHHQRSQTPVTPTTRNLLNLIFY